MSQIAFDVSDRSARERQVQARAAAHTHVAILSGGHDLHYTVPLAVALARAGVLVDLVGSNALECADSTQTPGLNFLNLRGDQREDAPLQSKIVRLLTYYARLVRYAATSRASVLHILWHNKFEVFDKTVLLLYYRLVGKRITFTAHNVNAAQRDARDSWINRLALRIQYHLCDHIFVHTARMKSELVSEFGVSADRVTVIPYGVNNMIPTTSLTRDAARQRLGLSQSHNVVLFFGLIAPYKGLEYLVQAVALLAPRHPHIHLVISGQVKRGHADYWDRVQNTIHDSGIADRVTQRIEFIPDADVEYYFKAADVLVIPYTDIFQSGIQFMGYSFGLPVIASDVGSLREDVIDDKTGFICPPRDAGALASTIDRYFSSQLYEQLDARRDTIREFVDARHSWATVAGITRSVYEQVAGNRP